MAVEREDAPDADQIAALTRINLDDFFDSLGWAGLRRGRRALEALVRPAARRFALEIVHFDRLCGARGLAAGSDWLLRRYCGAFSVEGVERVPASGPLLVLSNHPGMADTIACFSALNRADLKIIALDRPFLRELRHVRPALIPVPNDAEGDRLSVLRHAIRHLRSGGAVATFPAGKIEPDPATMRGARESLAAWSESATVFAQRVPETTIVPVLISGVQSALALRNPMRAFRRSERDKDKLSAALQILIPAYRMVPIRVRFGAPILAAEALRAHPEPEGLMAQVRAAMATLIDGSRSP